MKNLRIIRDPGKFQREMLRLRRLGKSIGFVPTMGALHEGHCRLIRACKRENAITAVSIFVNPAQFNDTGDLKHYPRPLAADKKILKKEKVDYLFLPSVGGMYPETPVVKLKLEGLRQVRSVSENLCGAYRPGHFEGVVTVVAKLLNIALPDRLYMGAKDYQQSVVIARLIEDLNFPVRMRRVATVRERDGLAMSSRNRHLSPAERGRARALSETLFWLRGEAAKRGRNPAGLRRRALQRMREAGLRVQYLEFVHPETLRKVKRLGPGTVAAAACYAGKTRLIDNVIMRP